MISESTKNFFIATATQSRQSNYSSKPIDKHCEHCNRDGHTIDNCCTLKFYCKFCNKRGHIKDRCKFKNGTWNSNNLATPRNRNNQSQQHGSHPFYAANAIESSQTMRGVSSQDNNSLNATHGFTADQLQQLALALSQMTPNHTTSNDNAYVNAACMFSSSNAINFVFTKPWILDSGATNHITTDSNLFTYTDISPTLIIKLLIESLASITSTGTIPFNSNTTLNKALCVLSFHLNLIFVSKITTALNYYAILFPISVSCRTWLRGRWLAWVNNMVLFIACLRCKGHLPLIKFLNLPTYSTCVLDIRLHLD